jgi:hypothetical protein
MKRIERRADSPGRGRRRRLLAPAILTLALATATLESRASAQVMIEPDRVELPVPASAPTSGATRLRRIILAAARAHDWQLVQERPGVLTLKLQADAHGATIDVPYDDTGFQIKYRESVDLDYAVEGGRAMIHPRYNRWISLLSNEIRQRARVVVPRPPRRLAIDPFAEAPVANPASGATP